MRGSSVADYDGDGDLDMLVNMALFRNERGTFSEVASNISEQVAGTALSHAWGDVDGDGDLDVFIATESSTHLLLNSGPRGNFTFVLADRGTRFYLFGTIGSGRESFEDAAFGDIDNDGDLDLVVSMPQMRAISAGTRYDRLLVNNGSGHFTDMTETQVPSVYQDSGQKVVAWADVDNDGDLDLFRGGGYIYAGAVIRTLSSSVMRNDGNGSFTWGANLDPSAFAKCAAWGDLDGNGYPDLVVGNWMRQDQLWFNMGDFLFVLDTTSPIVNAKDRKAAAVEAQNGQAGSTHSVSIGDLDGDGDLDIVLGTHAATSTGFGSALYFNQGRGTFVLWESYEMIMERPSWCSDDPTCRVLGGPSSMPNQWLAHLADLDGDGDLDVLMDYVTTAADGVSTIRTVTALTNHVGGDLIEQRQTVQTQSTGIHMEAVERLADICDVDLDGDLDGIFVTGGRLVLMLNDGVGGFTRAPMDGGLNVHVGNLAKCGDVDNDGDVDVVQSCDSAGAELQSCPRVMINNGRGSFTMSMSNALVNNVTREMASLALGDLDNDGDLDLVMGGPGRGAFFSNVYLNDGTGVFSTTPRASGPGVDLSAFDPSVNSIDLGDIDNDGDVDAVITSSEDGFAHLFENTGGRLRKVSHSVLSARPTFPSAARLADIDGDGRLDVLISGRGYEPSGSTIQDPTLLFHNVGGGSFSVMNTSFMGLRSVEDFAFYDADADGDVDILFSGATIGTQSNLVYENNGRGNFHHIVTNRFSRINDVGAIVTADLDGDADLDILILPNYRTSRGVAIGGNHVVLLRQHCPSGGHVPMSSACLLCPESTVRLPTTDRCQECPVDMVAGNGDECVLCPAGLQRLYGDGNCTACPPCDVGFFCPTAGRMCARDLASASVSSAGPQPCPAGVYGADRGLVVATCSGPCAPGHYCGPGSTIPDPPVCGVGFFLDDRPHHATNGTCTRCPLETTQCQQASTTLENLPLKPGYWRVHSRSLDIVPCFAAAACINLRTPLVFLPPGGQIREVDNMILDVNRFPYHASDGSILHAPSAGSMLEDAQGNPKDIHSILVSSGQLQAPAAINYTVCAPGQADVYCAVCAEHWYRSGSGSAELCQECGGGVALGAMRYIVPAVVLLALLVASSVYFCCSGSSVLLDNLADRAAGIVEATADGGHAGAAEAVAAAASDAATEATDAAKEAATEVAVQAQETVLQTAEQKAQSTCPALLRILHFLIAQKSKFKILVSLFQVLNGIAFVFVIPYPRFYLDVIESIRAIEISLPDLMPLECMMATNYYTTLVARTLIPFTIVVFLFTIGILSSKLGCSGCKEGFGSNLNEFGVKCINAGFFVIFLVYPSVSSAIFGFFVCQDLPEGQGSRMRLDLSLSCSPEEDPTRSAMFIYAVAMMVIFPFGVPSMYAYLLLYKHRETLEEERHEELVEAGEAQIASLLAQERTAVEPNPREHVPSYVRDLVGGYEMRTYYFEILEALRKVALVGIPVFFNPGSSEQLTLGLIVCFLSFGLYMSLAPFKLDSDDLLQQACQVQIFFSLLSALVLKTETNSGAMGAILSVMLFIPMVLGVAMSNEEIVTAAFEKVNKCCCTARSRVITKLNSTAKLENEMEAPPADEAEELQEASEKQPLSPRSSPRSPTISVNRV